MTVDVDELLTVAQVSGFIQVPENTLYAWKYRGEGPPVYKVGRHLRYRRVEVLKWLDEQRVPGGSP